MPLSKTSKLDGILSWSLQAGETCPGSIRNGKVIPVCQICYAKQNNYHYPNVKNVRAQNKKEWKSDTWVDDMVSIIKTQNFWRWFDSGDVYSISLAEKIYEIMVKTPDVKHWLPTKMGVFPKFRKILDKMNALPNVVVRESSDSLLGKYEDNHGSTVFPSYEIAKETMKKTNTINWYDIKSRVIQFVNPTEKLYICEAYQNPQKNCNGCRKCWSKDVKVVGYIAHGMKAKKVIRLALENG